MSLPANVLKRNLNKSDSNDSYFAVTHSDQTDEKTEVLKISFNGSDVIEVDKQKLLQKSMYFQVITSPRFNDHQKDKVEVNFDASIESFKQIISYIVTDDIIKKNNDNILEVFALATYLQIDSLFINFKDTFIYNLNTRTLCNQLSMIENNPLFKDFEEVALNFKKNGKPSVSGLYILESFKNSIYCICLKSLFDKESYCKLVSPNSEFDYRRQFYVPGGMGCKFELVVQFRNTIIVSDYEFYYQYNLITDVLVRIYNVPSYCKFCCDDKNLYAVEPNVKLKINVFRSIDCEEQLQISQRKTFNSIKVDYIISLICYNGKIYILYSIDNGDRSNLYCNLLNRDCGLNKQLCFVSLLILCTKTFTVLNNFKVKDRLSVDEKVLDVTCSSGLTKFLTMFHDKINNKLFIHTGENTPILVFDVRKETFYFVENTINGPSSNFDYLIEFCADYNHNIVYKLVKNSQPENENHKITAYEYVNEKFVDTGFECKYFAEWLSIYFV